MKPKENFNKFLWKLFFGEFEWFSYQGMPYHHQNENAHSNAQCHLRLMDYYLNLWNLFFLKHFLVFHIYFFLSLHYYFLVHCQSPLYKFYQHYLQMNLHHPIKLLCYFHFSPILLTHLVCLVLFATQVWMPPLLILVLFATLVCS